MAYRLDVKEKKMGTYMIIEKKFWDKEKKMSRAKRVLIGRVDPATGEIIPTDGRCKKDKIKKENEPDYEALYEKALKKCEAQSALISALQNEIKLLKGQD